MKWPWQKQVEQERVAIRESEWRREAIESNWDFIREQVRVGRGHRHSNHIADLIIGVARGQH